MNTNYIRVHSGCGGEMIKNISAKHFLEEYLCLKCNKTTWDLGCKVEKAWSKDNEN